MFWTIVWAIITAVVILAAASGLVFLLVLFFTWWKFKNFKGAGWLIFIIIIGIITYFFHG